MNVKSPKLDLTQPERAALSQHKIKTSDIAVLSICELQSKLAISEQRARKLRALAEFQQIPSIGPKFAIDLVKLGYDSLEELKGKDGAILTDEFEQLCGEWVGPCVEDQFRLVVHYASHRDSDKRWWDFTKERKQYREQYGYPEDRPQKVIG